MDYVISGDALFCNDLITWEFISIPSQAETIELDWVENYKYILSFADIDNPIEYTGYSYANNKYNYSYTANIDDVYVSSYRLFFCSSITFSKNMHFYTL